MSVLIRKADLCERITPLPVPERGDSLLHLAVWVALYAIAAVTTLQPIDEYDTWWHLRTSHLTLDAVAIVFIPRDPR